MRAFRRLSTARVLQEPLEQEHPAARGWGRDARQEPPQGSRHGYAEGPVQTAEGILRWQLPQGRGLRAPSRSKRWAALGRPSDGWTTLLVARYAGGMAHRALESALEKARGPVGLSTSAVSAITDRLRHAYAALRTRDLSGYGLADLLIAAV